MVFSSFVFLMIFLPCIIFFHSIISQNKRNFFLFLASLFFYAWGEPIFLSVLLFSIIINYLLGLAIDKYNFKKLILFVGVIINILILFYFKYAVFFIQSILGLFLYFGFIPFKIPEIWLPIGISFFTFQSISYLIDIYRGEIKAEKNFVNLGTYIALFPQLIAGPIVRYQSIMTEIKSRSTKLIDIVSGIKIFIIGLCAKTILANPVGKIADTVYSAQQEFFCLELAWLGAIAYAFQIYFDFAGYSTMAIGLGRSLGFTFPVNFNFPYISKSITEFWRRWHITLSSWFRDYLYIPLGGNRGGRNKTYRNLIMVFIATGFWHGANWTFLVWGLWHGFFLVAERHFRGASFQIGLLSAFCLRLYVLPVIIIGWVFFRSATIDEAVNYIIIMFNINNIKCSPLFFEIFNNYNIFQILLCCFFCIPTCVNFVNNIITKNSVLDTIVHIALFFLAIVFIASQDFNPFLYFRF